MLQDPDPMIEQWALKEFHKRKPQMIKRQVEAHDVSGYMGGEFELEEKEQKWWETFL